jgi:hypothetical protein
MVLEINTTMNSMITKEEFQNKFEKLVTKSDLEKVVDRVKREITTEMTEKIDKLENRILKEVIFCCTLSFSPVCGFFYHFLLVPFPVDF